MPRCRSRSRISASPAASSCRPTSSNSSASLTSITTTPCSVHSAGSTRSSQTGAIRTMRTRASSCIPFEDFVWSGVRAWERQSWPSPPGLPSRSAPGAPPPLDSQLGRRLGRLSADAWLMAAFAVARCRNAWQGYSRILQRPSSSLRKSSRRSTTKRATRYDLSSDSTWRVMILRKPRRSSFCSAFTSSDSRTDFSAACSLMLAMDRRSRCCTSSWRCHSFCVLRQRDLKAMRTREPTCAPVSPSAPKFITSACMISRSSPSLSSTASTAEW
mmetsp:Transcript_106656/g.301692  ORF Transcript_106656/g.301692 Transcript_106656/m.301692 type:complete len:272 (+) Transcript_106656:1244-2059(+)